MNFVKNLCAPAEMIQLTLKLEGEVVGQMPALVVTSQQPKGVGVPDLEGPQV
jgi:hypothetical protein